MYSHLADAVLVTHVAFVLFVVLGLALIVVGGFRGWRWIRHSVFRVVHLAGIGVVVVQSWLGVVCPLTTLEMWLRERAGGETYDVGFIQYWFQRVLYYDAPEWVFVLVYSVFGLLVLLAVFRFPPELARGTPGRSSRCQGSKERASGS